MHFLVQKEVGQRICASNKSGDWGRLGVKIAALFETAILFDVPPESFDIKPKVQSSFIRLTPRVNPLIALSKFMEFSNLVDQSFANKRKGIKNNLKKLEINYEKLATASIHLHNGIPMVASHPDMVCPSPEGGLPDTGAYMELFEATTGVRPVHICGKPNPGMILHKIEELGLRAENCAMIGDRIYTDIEMAHRSGVKGILVLSGEATRSDANESSQKPSLIIESVASLL